MDPQVQASFIPKKPLDTGVRGSAVGAGLLFLVALLVFIASIVSAGAAFAYKGYLTNSIAAKSKQLELAQGAYDPTVIQDLLRLDSRINQAKGLMGKHIAASAIFNYLSTQTLEKVAFSNFGYTLQSDGSASITLSGQGDSFSTVALQSDQFGASKVLKNVVFSGITVSPSGTISFSVQATLVPSLLLYSNALSGSTTVPGTSAATTTTP
jgi:hypothetical protein